MTLSWVEILGLGGAACYLLAFIEVTLNRWNGKSFFYELFNVFGAALLGVYAYQKHAYSNIVLNAIWAVVALYGIKHIVSRHKHRRQAKKRRR